MDEENFDILSLEAPQSKHLPPTVETKTDTNSLKTSVKQNVELKNDVQVPCPVPPPEYPLQLITPNSTDEEIIEADAKTAHFVLASLYHAWGKTTLLDTKGVCQLATTTMKTLESRRHLLNRTYGNTNSKKEGGVVSPID